MYPDGFGQQQGAAQPYPDSSFGAAYPGTLPPPVPYPPRRRRRWIVAAVAVLAVLVVAGVITAVVLGRGSGQPAADRRADRGVGPDRDPELRRRAVQR